MTRNNFFISNWEFDDSELELRSKFQMINIAILLSTSGLIFGIITNIIKNISGLIPLELVLIGINVILFFTLRLKKNSINVISTVITAQFTFLFLFLIYTSEPELLKHVWIFTYPIVLLYFQKSKFSIYWVVFIISALIIAPIQPFVEVKYTQFQVIYMSFVLVVVNIIIYFYQKKMDEARNLILQQQKSLENKMQELEKKDRLISVQSKQAVMGEMISMIAHQWRQPLSTVTLSISDMQIKRMLGEDIDDKWFDDKLLTISDTVVYLSNTIDDFQTYFDPKKSVELVMVNEVVKKVVNLIEARLNDTGVILELKVIDDEEFETYVNELIQILINILNNAIDVLESLGKTEAKIKILIKSRKDYIDISIEDNANGISDEHIEKIFEPYFSTKGKNGTGLGLYMSQMIMQKQFNSKINVTSSKNGSIFLVSIPIKLS